MISSLKASLFNVWFYALFNANRKNKNSTDSCHSNTYNSQIFQGGVFFSSGDVNAHSNFGAGFQVEKGGGNDFKILEKYTPLQISLLGTFQQKSESSNWHWIGKKKKSNLSPYDMWSSDLWEFKFKLFIFFFQMNNLTPGPNGDESTTGLNGDQQTPGPIIVLLRMA